MLGSTFSGTCSIPLNAVETYTIVYKDQLYMNLEVEIFWWGERWDCFICGQWNGTMHLSHKFETDDIIQILTVSECKDWVVLFLEPVGKWNGQCHLSSRGYYVQPSHQFKVVNIHFISHLHKFHDILQFM